MGDAAKRVGSAFGGSTPPKGHAEQLTQGRVENEILRLSAKMEELTDELAGRARMAAEAEANHKGRWASEFLSAQGTEAVRKGTADVNTHDLFLTRKINEGLYDSTKEALRSLRVQIDSLRTISANIRAQT